jgi:hypothetical protein
MNRGILAAKGQSIEEEDDLIKEIELFKRRQNGEAKQVVLKSNESMRELYQSNLRPLFIEFVAMMGRMDELFSEARITTNFPEVQDRNWEQVLEEWTALPHFKEHDSIELVYALRGFKGNAPEPFNVSSQISVSFGEFNYTINVAGKNVEKKLYGLPIAESERKAILRSLLEKVFDEIKKRSGEL